MKPLLFETYPSRARKVVLFMDTYNSIDLTPNIEGANYKALPRSLQKYFEKPTQEEDLVK